MAPPLASPRRTFIRNMILLSRIGVHPHEHGRTQRVRVSVDLEAQDNPLDPTALSDVVDYERLANAIRAVVAAGHSRLVENLAHQIAAVCLADSHVSLARVEVEKLDVFDDAESAGVSVVRTREVIPARSELS